MSSVIEDSENVDNLVKGGENPFLSELIDNEPENFVIMAIQAELLELSKSKFVHFDTIPLNWSCNPSA